MKLKKKTNNINISIDITNLLYSTLDLLQYKEGYLRKNLSRSHNKTHQLLANFIHVCKLWVFL